MSSYIRTILTVFTAGFNPLLMGTRALISYYHQLEGLPDQPEPYLLLIVRPDGSRAFYIARALLKQLHQPFGYELVQEDWDISADSANEEAREICIAAISRVMQEREKVLVELNTSSRNESNQQLNLSGSGKHFEVEDERRDIFKREGRLIERSQQYAQQGTGKHRKQPDFLSRYKSPHRIPAEAGNHGRKKGTGDQSNPFHTSSQSNLREFNSDRISQFNNPISQRSGGNQQPGAITSRRGERYGTKDRSTSQSSLQNKRMRPSGRSKSAHLYPDELPLPAGSGSNLKERQADSVSSVDFSRSTANDNFPVIPGTNPNSDHPPGGNHKNSENKYIEPGKEINRRSASSNNTVGRTTSGKTQFNSENPSTSSLSGNRNRSGTEGGRLLLLFH